MFITFFLQTTPSNYYSFYLSQKITKLFFQGLYSVSTTMLIMKTLIFSFKKKLFIYFLLLIIIGGCAIPIPIPEQNFNSNITNEEYDVFDQSASNLRTFRKEMAEKNNRILATLEKHAVEKEIYKSWYEKSLASKKFKQELEQMTNDIWNEILLASGGDDVNGYPLGADQKITAQKILFQKGKAKKLQDQILKTKDDWLGLILLYEDDLLEKNFTPTFQNNDWVSKNTKNIQIGVLQLSFANLLFEIEKTHGIILEYFWGKIKSPPLVANAYKIVSSPKSSYVIKGDKYEADIFLAPVVNSEKNEINITINGRRMPLDNGIAKLKITAPSVGEKMYNVSVNYQDLITGETIAQKKTFNYNVGLVSMTTSADKMNVFYQGVDNPITISAAGIPNKDLEVTIEGATIIKQGNRGNYIVRITEPTNRCTITVKSSKGIKGEFMYRIKPIPSPDALLAGHSGGEINLDLFKSEQGLYARLENFDFDARCQVSGYEVSLLRKGEEIQTVTNAGPRYSKATRDFLQEAKVDDIYLYENVMARCPGDLEPRKINSLVFKIK